MDIALYLTRLPCAGGKHRICLCTAGGEARGDRPVETERPVSGIRGSKLQGIARVRQRLHGGAGKSEKRIPVPGKQGIHRGIEMEESESLSEGEPIHLTHRIRGTDGAAEVKSTERPAEMGKGRQTEHTRTRAPQGVRTAEIKSHE